MPKRRGPGDNKPKPAWVLSGTRRIRARTAVCAGILLGFLVFGVQLGLPGLSLSGSFSALGAPTSTTSQGGQPSGSSGQPSGAAQSGADLYLQKCAGCHGPRAHGTNSGPSLKAAGSAIIVAPKIREGGPGMPSFAGVLTDAQIQAIADYVAENRADPTARGVTEAEGAQVFFLYCASCHGSIGRGGAMTGGNNAPVLDNVNGGDVLAAFIRGPGEMPEFAGGTLTNRQMSAVALYVQEIIAKPPSPGGWGVGYRGPVHEGFFALFVGLGGLILLARWAQGGSRHGADA